ncbi:MAG: flagellar export protein FliJ [Pirellula sp.]|nr:flagellar export protein FliJ [Pirellula sp.]
MRFQFRLQTLLRLREAARDERREQLAEVMRIDDALRKQLTELEGLQSEARALQRLGVGRVDVDRLLEAQRYEAVVALEILHVERQRAAVAEEMNKRQEALVEADREFKVLEKLREKRLSEHGAEVLAQEMKLLDEAAGRMKREEVDV